VFSKLNKMQQGYLRNRKLEPMNPLEKALTNLIIHPIYNCIIEIIFYSVEGKIPRKLMDGYQMLNRKYFKE